MVSRLHVIGPASPPTFTPAIEVRFDPSSGAVLDRPECNTLALKVEGRVTADDGTALVTLVGLDRAVVVDWLLQPPASKLKPRHLMLALVFPAVYLVYVVLRGASTGWYP